MTMTTNTWVCGACSAHEIKDLGHNKDALSAMILFCQQQLHRYSPSEKFPKLASFYVFVAGPEVPGKGHSKPWVQYGTEFATFIEDNGLGRIVTLPKKKNFKYHADTYCQVWIWSPDQEAMEAWWLQHNPDTMKDPAFKRGAVK